MNHLDDPILSLLNPNLNKISQSTSTPSSSSTSNSTTSHYASSSSKATTKKSKMKLPCRHTCCMYTVYTHCHDEDGKRKVFTNVKNHEKSASMHRHCHPLTCDIYKLDVPHMNTPSMKKQHDSMEPLLGRFNYQKQDYGREGVLNHSGLSPFIMSSVQPLIEQKEDNNTPVSTLISCPPYLQDQESGWFNKAPILVKSPIYTPKSSHTQPYSHPLILSPISCTSDLSDPAESSDMSDERESIPTIYSSSLRPIPSVITKPFVHPPLCGQKIPYLIKHHPYKPRWNTHPVPLPMDYALEIGYYDPKNKETY